MKQAIAGVSPFCVEEKTTMVVWPSVAAYSSGRWLGRLYSLKGGFHVFTVGNFLALASIPHALGLYFFRLATGKCYKLTNRRVMELATSMKIGFRSRFPFIFLTLKIGAEVKSVELDRFDTIEIEVLPGQAWYHAGDLVFKRGNVETFRLEAVSRPESFRHTCLKSRQAYVGVKRALEHQRAVA